LSWRRVQSGSMNENSDNVERGDTQGDLSGRGAFQIILPSVQMANRFQEWLADVLHSDFWDLSIESYHFRRSTGQRRVGMCVVQENLAYDCPFRNLRRNPRTFLFPKDKLTRGTLAEARSRPPIRGPIVIRFSFPVDNHHPPANLIPPRRREFERL